MDELEDDMRLLTRKTRMALPLPCSMWWLYAIAAVIRWSMALMPLPRKAAPRPPPGLKPLPHMVGEDSPCFSSATHPTCATSSHLSRIARMVPVTNLTTQPMDLATQVVDLARGRIFLIYPLSKKK